MANVTKSLIKNTVIDAFALNPNKSVEEVSKETGATMSQIYRWRRDINFVEAIYKRYMVEYGAEIPSVLNAMIREAKAGNVQAGRLVLEHSGKLVKNISVTVASPFEKFMSKVESVNIEDAEYEDGEVLEIVKELPEIPEKEEIKTNADLKKEQKRKDYNKKQKEMYVWRKRAKAVGVPILASKKPTKGQRETWKLEIIKRENEARETIK